MSSVKLERLLTLMSTLLGAGRALGVDELRSKVPGYPEDDASFRRAFERDKDELRTMGVPLIVETIAGSYPPVAGYRIREKDYVLRDPGLEPDELEALNLAAAVVGVAGGVGQQALFKLGSGATRAPQVEIPTNPELLEVFEAVAERKVIHFQYHGAQRELHPYRLQFVRGRWYLNGFDRLRGEDRWFRMERIEGPITVDPKSGAFARPLEAVAGLQLDPWVLGGSKEAVTARVWFDPLVAGAVAMHLQPQDIVSNDQSGLIAELKVANREGFRSWVLSYLDRAEILSPPELRDDVVSWLRDIASPTS